MYTTEAAISVVKVICVPGGIFRGEEIVAMKKDSEIKKPIKPTVI